MEEINWPFRLGARPSNQSNAEAAPEPSTSRSSAPVRTHQERLLDLQAESFGKPELTDFEIHVGDKVFKINRYFLCLHSDVFSAYLNSDSIEKNTNTIQIKDLDPVFIEAMLRFMYSGRVENLKDIAHDLYIVADRYNIRILQDICLEFMFNNLDMKHIFNCLELAFQLDIEDLKQKSIEFAIRNVKQLQEQEEWSPLVKRNPDISITLMQHLTSENERLKKRVEELEAQKCPHHHCRIPHHEILLRRDRDRQLQRLRDQMRENADAEEEPRMHDRYYHMIAEYVRRQRERRNLPPLDQLPINERNAIIAQAHHELNIDSDDETLPIRELQRAPIQAVEDGQRPQQEHRQVGRLWGYRPNQRLREALEAEVPPVEQRRRRYPNLGEPRMQWRPRQQGMGWRQAQNDQPADGADRPENWRFRNRNQRNNEEDAPEAIPLNPLHARRREQNEADFDRQPQRLQVIELDGSDSDHMELNLQPQPEAERAEPAPPVDGAEPAPQQPALDRLFVQVGTDSDNDSDN